MPKYSFCNNCGKQGHLYHQCKRPITSIGIVAFRKHDSKLQYLMICRKNSLGYVDFMRGKYKLHNHLLIRNLIDEMTNEEKQNILTNDFNYLWTDLWGEYVGMQYRSEETSARDKFKALQHGIKLKSSKEYNLKSLIDESKTNWKMPEWGFPKGRRNYQENDISCALREFEEETGYHRKNIHIIQNIIPFEEIFTGSNFKSYKHKYYIGIINNECKPTSDFQQSEVSEVKWLDLEECLNIIRPYNLEKKEILIQINKTLQKYRLIS